MNVLVKIGSILLIATAFVEASKFMSEKPDFLIPCYLKDPGFKKCFGQNFEGITREWKDGIPGYKEAGTFDPLLVKRIVIAQDGNSAVSLNAELTDIKIKGASKMQVQEADFNPKSLVTKVKLFVPKLRFESDYKVNGRILNLPLTGNGKAEFEVEKFDLYVNIKLKLRDEHSYTFTDVVKLQVDVSDIGGFHVHLGNLFNGQKDLGDSTNAVLNESWRDFYEVLRPSIIEAIQVVLKDRISKAFAYVPANYFIADIPSAAAHSG